MTRRSIHTGLVQLGATPLDLEGNLERAGEWVDRVVAQGAELVVLPEMFSCGFYVGAELMSVAETRDGPTLAFLRERADRHGVHLVTSFYERERERYYNTLVLVGPSGTAQFYRKRNPTLSERAAWEPGAEPGPGVFDTPLGRIGCAICFDSFARETFEGFLDNRVQLIVIVACWGWPAGLRPDAMVGRAVLEPWSVTATEVVPRRYAQQLGVPVVFVNQGGEVTTPAALPPPLPAMRPFTHLFQGRSKFLDGRGEVLAGATGNEDGFMAVADLEPGTAEDLPPISRVGVEPDYLERSWYFEPPSLLARACQALSSRALVREYEKRCREG